MSDEEHDEGQDENGSSQGQRLDKWLWFARVVKTRTLAAKLVAAGKVRLNRQRIEKPSQSVKVGDVLTIAVHERIKVLEVRAMGLRRGPAAEAQLLFADVSPPVVATAGRGPAGYTPSAGRPSKRERRQIERVKTGSDMG